MKYDISKVFSLSSDKEKKGEGAAVEFPYGRDRLLPGYAIVVGLSVKNANCVLK